MKLLVSDIWIVAVAAWLLYLIYLGVYRLFFHPLRKFPGPLSARLTDGVEFYWDFICRGQYIWRLREWHRRYGPVIRISPDELHIADSSFYDTVYPGTSVNRPIDKWYKQARLFGTSLSAFGTAGHDLHRARRAALAPFLNRRAVSDLEPLISAKLDLFVEKLRRLRGTGMPINLFAAFSAVTGDIISEYSFGKPLGLLSDDDFAPDWHRLIVDSAVLGALGRHFGLLWPLLDSIPPRILHWLDPPMARVTSMHSLTQSRIEQVISSKELTSDGDFKALQEQRTIFHEILESDLPASEKSLERLRQEADVLMAAGTVTTAEALAVICFHILNQPTILNTLREELQHLVRSTPDVPRWQDLEQLPYLTAVIKEGLRASPGVTARLARIHPGHAIECHGWTIPPGTPISMSSYTVHHDPALFPDPLEFRPERWLSSNKPGQKGTTHPLDAYLVSFTKGTRQCVGLTLAWAEMYLTLSKLFGGAGPPMELFETSASDVEIVGDIFNPGYSTASKGVRVTVL